MTNKLKFFVGNWKMNGDLNSIKTLKKINFFLRQKKSLLKIKTVVCLPFTLLYPFSKYLRNTEIIMGAQNCHEFGTYGSFTGSISAQMIKNTGAKYVIIGHSENRFNGDDNTKIKKKIESAVDQNLNIIYCVGESYKQKKEKKTFKIIKNQISSIIKKKIDPNKFILAYEPIWSIGTGKLPKAEDLKSIILYIKKIFKKKVKNKKNLKVLYGGSVNSLNIQQFSGISEIDGFLIGGDSLSSKKFIDIIKKYYT